MGATPSQVLVFGLYRSTEFRQLVPSLPPCNIKHALQYSNSCAAPPAQHVGNGSPDITLKKKITSLVIYLTMKNKHKTHPRDVFNMCHLPEGRTFLPWLSVRSCHTHRPHTNCHLIEEIGETGSCFLFNFNCLRYRGSAFTFITTLALHIST